MVKANVRIIWVRLLKCFPAQNNRLIIATHDVDQNDAAEAGGNSWFWINYCVGDATIDFELIICGWCGWAAGAGGGEEEAW